MQEILSGKIAADQFFAGYARPGEPIDNPFACTKMGVTIKAVKFSKLPNADNDEVETTFGPPNPAISELKIERSDADG
ncbi:MAG: hypothetical protein AB7I42_19130 [Bradyrhizobium sp.]|uniref:hypothetical protein n=1 Tax=Bradyrhizobium sp. TaxID=376 RepID=UPI003D103928